MLLSRARGVQEIPAAPKPAGISPSVKHCATQVSAHEMCLVCGWGQAVFLQCSQLPFASPAALLPPWSLAPCPAAPRVTQLADAPGNQGILNISTNWFKLPSLKNH